MSDNKQMQNTENTNEWINWIEEAIVKEHLKYYEYKEFSNFQEIGTGGFGKVYRAKWKNLEKSFALKSFFSLNNITMKEIVQNHLNNNYMLVIEYADGGSLRNYLKENFGELTWDDKYLMAYQLACAVSCLHDEKIIHRDLHSGNILVHKNTIKLADFGLSKRIGASSNFQSKLFGMVPYVDPKSFSRRRNNNQMFTLNEKSDVYSVGVLLWEISSGQPPFYAEDEHYDVGLIYDISQGHRETVVPDTPEDYIKIYTKCWDGEPDNRPTIYQVVDWLKAKITKTDIITENPQLSDEQELNEVPLSTNNSESQGDLSQLIQNFNKMNTKEIDNIVVSSEQEILLNEKDLKDFNRKDFSIIVDEINDLIYKLCNKGIEWKLVREQVIEYFNNYNTNSQEINNWLLNNQNNSNSIFLLGYFNFYVIETSRNYEKAFKLFINSSEKNHILAQSFVGGCYQYGNGTKKNEKLAFKYFEKLANKNFTHGQLKISYCYENGIGIEKDLKKAFYWYEKAANNGNILAKHNLGLCYKNGKGVEKDYNKAFELFKQSADGGYLGGITMLGNCCFYGIGTKIDKQKAFELCQKSANLGQMVGQSNLALMYESGNGIIKDMDKAIYWYEKSAKQGYQDAQNRLEILQKNK
ncbi:kinase-like domain-containing protein [Rhizophagus irregularis DAOM 181602=DAOM 197198]|uniref:Kinase-like domain-containing protein n=1 Tax=Rhizophagus irregularis (strain DAOM 181602 / DAOM 197198 / MUCL 43194) TaxID=747089 RepID=A0A2P4PJY2_RHIID|nr:kinase-like domain-containing protein [Rhizophagus irregularis DAOM 181602=DAOM 197198]POG65701.1 kinase-like domain-containing protein [Rhizophagus irregularis DAOM 181602=DAOM 197198]|eukprot:XP_025172567.1 kinase-like domain-containing protein [Rhizophagus irregularis DAOM 181602=DAOM 197198]